MQRARRWTVVVKVKGEQDGARWRVEGRTHGRTETDQESVQVQEDGLQIIQGPSDRAAAAGNNTGETQGIDTSGASWRFMLGNTGGRCSCTRSCWWNDSTAAAPYHRST